MSVATVSDDRRCLRRTKVESQAECWRGDNIATTTVKDINRLGAFVTSRARHPSGGFTDPSILPLEQVIQVGDHFLLFFYSTPLIRDWAEGATVCWKGYSDEHGCHGYGVLFDLES